MRVIVARNAGFCFGVRRAVELARAEARRRGRVYTWGKLIHNETVVKSLSEEGILPVDTLEGLTAGDTLIVRAHGAPPALFAACQERQIRTVDATCPFVERIHPIVQAAARQGIPVYIAGKRTHPEVIGTAGWAEGRAVVLESAREAEQAPTGEEGCLVAQTTLSEKTFEEISAILRRRVPKLSVHNTICRTTRTRQEEAEGLSRRCTKMLVLGSSGSANTIALANLCKIHCPDTKMIDDIGKIPLELFKLDDIIGLVTGASTPDPMIREVIQGMSELEKTTIETNEAEAPAEVVAEPTEKAVEEAVVAAEEPVVAAVEQAEEPVAEEAAKAEETVEAVVEEAKEAAAPVKDAAEDFQQAIDSSIRRIRPGQIVTGTVIGITDSEVLVNVGYKSDGYIPRAEFSTDPEAEIDVKEGEEIDVEVVKVNDGEGNVLLSRKNVQSKKFWDDLMAEETEGKTFETVVKEVVKGGLIAEMEGGVRAFIPASHVSTKYVENLSEYVGKTVKVKVLEIDKQRKRIVASIKQVLLEEAAAREQAKWDALVVGSKIHGIVRRITDFGAFVDIGGLDGLVHVTDAAWGRVKHPSDVLSVNQEVDVLVLGVDKEKKRISLGYKQLQPKPWTMAGEKYPVGSIVEGKVVRIVPFGAFVALEPTIDGLIHISQVATRRIEKVEDELKVGDIVRCKVLEVNPEAKRISLSRKEATLEEHPEIAEQIAAEKAEKERIYQERKAARENAAQNNAERKPRAERPANSERPANDERRESRPDRRRRNSEDGEYELPPVTSTTTSLADLFAGFKTEE
ncbi:MAG: bifunctional 4-hydroxy-3-methylbut-2-enyl diphosphate reductase/30S ribosomal protein S1 [Clostridia bacterium]|nr:bifunctional 4-hydroxy-3-methylbut-2-enyl diphosphate reductase/30S ribosomal protein S1 [Clostridia bacterium]